MQGKDISGLSVWIFMGPSVKSACTTNLVKEGKWWRYPKSTGAALHCSGADFNPRCEERTPWFPKLAEGCPHSTATPSQGHTAEHAHDPSPLCFFKSPHLEKSAYVLGPNTSFLCVFFPLWQPCCRCGQDKPGDAAGRGGLSPILAPGRGAGGLHAQLALALSAPYAAIWFC